MHSTTHTQPGRSQVTAPQHLTARRRPAPILLALAILLVLLPGMLFAQDGGASESEDDMFGGDLVTTDDDARSGGTSGDGQSGTQGGSLASGLLQTEETLIGGRYGFSFGDDMRWTELESLADISGYPEHNYFTRLYGEFYLDARPSEGFRVYAETRLRYPFSGSFQEVVEIRELFSDFQLGDSLFLRGGKHTVTWGVGYFFSPADIINLERIDPEDPEAERVGPVNLRVQHPFGANNAYLYLLPPTPSETWPALAPRAEFVLGSFELGTAAFWRYEEAPAFMATLEGTLLDFNLFGEAVLRLENDRTYVGTTEVTLENPLGLETYTSDAPVVEATAGLLWSWSDEEGLWNLSLSGQYLYNGDGYEDADLLPDNRNGVLALLGAGELQESDLASPGRHYGAVSASLRNILDTDLSASTLWYANLSDQSGRLSGSLRYRIDDYLSASLQTGWNYGRSGSEFAPAGESLTLSISADVGSGRF